MNSEKIKYDMWLNYFNNELYKRGVISEDKKNEMNEAIVTFINSLG